MSAPGSHVETEVKLGVWPGFRLPDLSGIGDGIVARPTDPQRLDATYHDTPDLRLARAGVTFRHRSDEGWTLKLPNSEAGGGVLSRRELTVAGDEATVPPELSRLVVAWVRASSLGPVARLQTLRHCTRLLDGEGELAAEVVDDEVSVVHGRRLALRFREVEVERGEAGGDELLEAVVARLRAAGAGPADAVPKVVRALGPRALDPPELADVTGGGDGSAATAIRRGLAASVRRLLAHDAGVRLGDDAEDVHQARVATRRLRSDLRTYRPLLDEAWAEELRGELKWVAGALGEVRDADVLLEGLEQAVAALAPSDAAAASSLLDRLRSQRAQARDQLLAVLDDRRYARLLDRLVGALSPPQLDEVPAVPAGAPAVVVGANPWLLAEADGPADTVLPELVRKPWKHLREAVAAVEPGGPGDELHQVRIRAKRCRYAAEVAAVAVGKPAKRFAEAVADVQDILGQHQDAVVAEAWLRSIVDALSPAEALVAGQLVAAQRVAAEATRGEWERVWAKVDRPKLRSWLEG